LPRSGPSGRRPETIRSRRRPRRAPKDQGGRRDTPGGLVIPLPVDPLGPDPCRWSGHAKWEIKSIVVGTLTVDTGHAGVKSRKVILAAVGFALGEDEATSEVYGMNKPAFVEGAIKAQFALDELPGILQDIATFRAGGQALTTPD
jgi:hypothetical protein